MTSWTFALRVKLVKKNMVFLVSEAYYCMPWSILTHLTVGNTYLNQFNRFASPRANGTTIASKKKSIFQKISPFSSSRDFSSFLCTWEHVFNMQRACQMLETININANNRLDYTRQPRSARTSSFFIIFSPLLNPTKMPIIFVSARG